MQRGTAYEIHASSNALIISEIVSSLPKATGYIMRPSDAVSNNQRYASVWKLNGAGRYGLILNHAIVWTWAETHGQQKILQVFSARFQLQHDQPFPSDGWCFLKRPVSVKYVILITVRKFLICLLIKFVEKTVPSRWAQFFNEFLCPVFAIVRRVYCFPQCARQDILLGLGIVHFARQSRRCLRVENNYFPCMLAWLAWPWACRSWSQFQKDQQAYKRSKFKILYYVYSPGYPVRTGTAGSVEKLCHWKSTVHESTLRAEFTASLLSRKSERSFSTESARSCHSNK